ncbi:IcmT/TraK family protein [Variovorax sp. LT1P1]|uniref:IcmT/TraK family protein n=1 Tax=Variovorax sp. LT1P1 TaxID=3443730 RepID=UPI003F44E04D
MDYNQSGTPSGIEWRYTAKKVRVGPFDATIVFPPLLFFAFNIAWWTLGIAVGVTLAMWLVEVFMRRPLRIVLRALRSNLAGNTRYAVPWWKKTRL